MASDILQGGGFLTLLNSQVFVASICLCAAGLGWAIFQLVVRSARSTSRTRLHHGAIGGKESSQLGLEENTFQTPAPEPTSYTPEDLRSPQPYRPFRRGPTFMTMGIRKLNWDDWIEMDSNFFKYHDLKAQELSKDLTAHVQYLDTPRVRDACLEVYEELALYLTRRYPLIYKLDGTKLHNYATGEQFTYPANDPQTALANAALLVQDDLIIMAKEEDGQYHLDAAAVCLPGFWRLKDKFRLSIDSLHIGAGVPHYKEKLQKSLNRFFDVLTPDKPVTRNNYFLQLDDGLHWSHRMGEQDGTSEASWAKADATGLTVEDLHFRSERQTLRRLPRSGCVLFTVRTYFEPITKIAQEPDVPGRLAAAIRSWDDNISHYKGRKHWEQILFPYLDEKSEQQAAEGLSKDHAEDQYPF